METKKNNEEYIITYNTSDNELKKERIDIYLAKSIPKYSRSAIARIISQECIFVNNRITTKASYLLQDGDIILIKFPEINVPIDKLQPIKINLEIVDLQKEFLLVNKPSGLLVHHAPSSSEKITLVNGLLYHFKELKDFEDTERPGIVHRLDKDTSGLILIARNPQAQRELSALFKNRKIKKTYLAIVHGHPDVKDSIDLPIGRHPTMRHKMSHVSYVGRKSLTEFETLVHYKHNSLIASHPKTGRTHQIRVHCAAIGHGILGDELYGKKSPHIKRQALHAWKLSFEYKGKEYNYCVSVPDDMKYLLKQLIKNR